MNRGGVDNVYSLKVRWVLAIIHLICKITTGGLVKAQCGKAFYSLLSDVLGIWSFFSFPEFPQIPCPMNKSDNIYSLLRYLINHTITSHKKFTDTRVVELRHYATSSAK